MGRNDRKRQARRAARELRGLAASIREGRADAEARTSARAYAEWAGRLLGHNQGIFDQMLGETDGLQAPLSEFKAEALVEGAFNPCSSMVADALEAEATFRVAESIVLSCAADVQILRCALAELNAELDGPDGPGGE